MTSGQIVGKMDTQKQLNVPLDIDKFFEQASARTIEAFQIPEVRWGILP